MLIVFEGPDGSGKTALVEAVKKVYDKKGIVSVVTKEPGSPHVEACKRIRGIVLQANLS